MEWVIPFVIIAIVLYKRDPVLDFIYSKLDKPFFDIDKNFLSEVKTIGYKIERDNSDILKLSYKKEIQIVLKKKTRRKKSLARNALKLHIAFFNVDIPQFKMSKKSSLTRLLDRKDEELIGEDYKIETTIPVKTIKYLLDGKNMKVMKNILRYYDNFICDYNLFFDRNEILIERHIDNTTAHFLLAIEAILSLRKKFPTTKKLVSYEIPMRKSNGKGLYLCTNCKNEINYNGESCPFCKAKVPSCVICLNDPEPLERVSFLGCCESYAHTKHLGMWLAENKKCPYCSANNPLYLDVVEKLTPNF